MRTTLKFIAHHPLTRDRPLAAFARVLSWQLRSRLRREVEFAWIDDAKLAVRRGMTGATGNIYGGLHEFADMGFVLHTLRPGDLFVDVGANVGSYTVLAAKVCGAEAIAFEPDPVTMEFLKRNLVLNGIEDHVATYQCALGATEGMVRFTIGRDTVNRVVKTQTVLGTREVPLHTLDTVLGTDLARVTLVKLDVEGYEQEVLEGAARLLASPSLIAVESEAENAAVVERFTAAGLVRRFYDPFTRKLSSTAHGSASNALFVRDEAAIAARLEAAPLRHLFGKAF
ncbi:FkbM family methyltransferase [Acuticoccus kandeliae]|uniref:FkbM family methyltransferase n=1 Tax=Acuticoccus kandeliae TaxID=2073160 RepID=UPI000D3E95C9|nr:FkbM family methyltransferase [Acuticoccus kandeliae]